MIALALMCMLAGALLGILGTSTVMHKDYEEDIREAFIDGYKRGIEKSNRRVSSQDNS